MSENTCDVRKLLGKVYNEDCLDLVKLIPDNSVDIIITDPPYGVKYQSNRRKNKQDKLSQGIIGDESLSSFSKITSSLYRILNPAGHCYVFCNRASEQETKNILLKNNFILLNTIIWDKCSHTAGDLNNWAEGYEIILFCVKEKISHKRRKIAYRGKNIIQANSVSDKNRLHPNEKPVSLITQLLKVSSYGGDVVFDPFAGSGSTLLAAKQHACHYFGCELDLGHYQNIIERLAQGMLF